MRHPYSEALFESIPRLNQDRRERLYSIPGLPPDLGRHLVGCRFLPRCRYGTEECARARTAPGRRARAEPQRRCGVNGGGA